MNNFHEEEAIVPILDLERLRVIYPLGRGAKGVVFLVEEEDAGELWALKVILRDLVEKRRDSNDVVGDYKRICFERQVLSRCNHPLLPRLRGVLSTDKVVGYAIDYCPGRDLHFLRKLQSEKMFSNDIIRFYAVELVMALEYLHGQGIAYRDLKPENIMIQESGHIMLVDFDLSTRLPLKPHQSSRIIASKPKPVARRRRQPSLHCFKSTGVSPDDRSSLDSINRKPDLTGKSNSFVGTEEYVAPEIIQGHGHDFAADWWSFGVLLYEMLYGVTPFKGSNRKETFLRILTKSPELVGEATPLRDLIGKLLIKDPRERITLIEIKEHEFFRGVDWDSVLQVTRPPHIPPVANVDEIGNNDKKIDVESFVQGIFGFKEEDKANGESNKAGDDNKKEGDDDANHNRGDYNPTKLWVHGLNNQPQEADSFLVF